MRPSLPLYFFVPGGLSLPLKGWLLVEIAFTYFFCKNHPANTPFGYSRIPLLFPMLLRELSRGTPSSSECHLQGGAMTVYQIRLKEKLDQRWSVWLGGLMVIHEANGETVLTGEVVDQAALHGLLSKVRDLHLTLISVTPLKSDSPSKEEAKEESL